MTKDKKTHIKLVIFQWLKQTARNLNLTHLQCKNILNVITFQKYKTTKLSYTVPVKSVGTPSHSFECKIMYKPSIGTVCLLHGWFVFYFHVQLLV